MTWTKISDQFLEDVDIARAGAIGEMLYLHGLMYCNRNLTDGFIPFNRIGNLIGLRGVWVERGNDGGDTRPEDHVFDPTELVHPDPFKVAVILCNVGLWEKRQGGFQVRNFGKYNPLKWQVLQERTKRDHLREVRAEAGKAGGKARWAIAKRTETEFKNGKSVANPLLPVPVPVPVPVPEPVPVPKTKPSKEGSPSAMDGVREIFKAWLSTLPSGTKRELTTTRKQKILSRLKDCEYSEVLDAVRGWPNDPWDDRHLHNDIEVLLRNREHVEKFRDFYRQPPVRKGAINTANLWEERAKELREKRLNGT